MRMRAFPGRGIGHHRRTQPKRHRRRARAVCRITLDHQQHGGELDTRPGLLPPRPDQRGYSASPQVRGLTTEIIGGTVPASHGVLQNVLVGRSDGRPNQTFRLNNYPLLPRIEGETVEVETAPGEWEEWIEVQDFADSTAGDAHYLCDSASGEIRSGPVLRGPDGTDVQYGRIPPAGAQLRFSRYRVGGGAKGNVGRNTLTVLKSSIPYVAAVSNRYSAQGGIDAETLEQAKLRAPSNLRSSDVAITAADYERCALAASDQVSRALRLPPACRVARRVA